jgi:hypothetical protein
VRVKGLVHNLWAKKPLLENLSFINESLGTDLDKYLNEQFWKKTIPAVTKETYLLVVLFYNPKNRKHQPSKS